jgi:outer membrane protein OmpA-like peptidoglycan-associated protein
MDNASASTPDLMGLVSSQITPEVIRRAAFELGEDRDRTARAISTSVPTVLTALSDVASSPGGAEHLEEVVQESRQSNRFKDGGTLLGTTTAAGNGTRLLDAELGDRSTTVTDAVAGSSGVKRDSAHKLLGGVTAVAIAALGKSVAGTGAMAPALRAQRGEWVRRLPGPLASLFGTAPVATATVVPQGVPVQRVERVERYEPAATGPAIRPLPAPRRSWALPILLIALAVLVFGLLRGLRRPAMVRQPTNVTQTMPHATAPAAPAPRVSVPLPDGRVLPLSHGSGTYEMATWLAGSGMPPQRFTLSPLNFEFNSTQLTAGSGTTVNDLAAILKAYPSAQIRIESHTDDVGTAAENLALSEARSDAVKDMLVARGIEPGRMESAGLGQANPIAGNDTAGGRAQNRRTDIVVTAR